MSSKSEQKCQRLTMVFGALSILTFGGLLFGDLPWRATRDHGRLGLGRAVGRSVVWHEHRSGCRSDGISHHATRANPTADGDRSVTKHRGGLGI